MKYKFFLCNISVVVSILLGSCTEIDNYKEPEETVYGKIIDTQGRPVYANAGSGSVRIKMLDYGYHETPSEYYLNVKTDGSYINEKQFESKYTMIPQGPFVPTPGVENVHVKGKTEVNFTVEPFFVVEWGEPALTPGDGTVTARVKVKRGTDNPSYQGAVTTVTLLISSTQYVGTNNYDNRVSPSVTGAAATAFLNNETSVTSLIAGSGDTKVYLKSGHIYYVRIGVISSSMNGELASAYNLSEIKKIVMP